MKPMSMALGAVVTLIAVGQQASAAAISELRFSCDATVAVAVEFTRGKFYSDFIGFRKSDGKKVLVSRLESAVTCMTCSRVLSVTDDRIEWVSHRIDPVSTNVLRHDLASCGPKP